MKHTRLVSWCCVALAAAFLSIVPLSAQGKWWQSDRHKRELGLTPEQSRRLEEIFQTAVPALKAHKQALDQAEGRFEQLVENGADRDVMEQVNTVEGARAELNKTRTMMLLRMRRVLTTDQWAKLTALHQADERDRERARHNAK
jgi:Spy/CpxP family protein refolding chaperone